MWSKLLANNATQRVTNAHKSALTQTHRTRQQAQIEPFVSEPNVSGTNPKQQQLTWTKPPAMQR